MKSSFLKLTTLAFIACSVFAVVANTLPSNNVSPTNGLMGVTGATGSTGSKTTTKSTKGAKAATGSTGTTGRSTENGNENSYPEGQGDGRTSTGSNNGTGPSNGNGNVGRHDRNDPPKH